MANFSYKAYDKKGTVKTGVVEATDQENAASLLRNLGLTVTALEAENKSAMDIKLSFGKKVSSKELVIFSRQLATMINSGLPLVRALRILEEQTENKEFKKILDGIASDVEAGSSLSISLGKYPKVFNKVYRTMIRSGEASGKLDEVLLSLADQLENDYAMVGKIRSAMAYPLFIMGALVIAAILMMILVVPQLKALFEQSNIALPWTTKALMAVSDFFVHYWWVVLILIIVAIFGFRAWIASPQGRRTWDRIKLKIPIFGSLSQKIYMVRFTRTLGTLISGGLPILEALEITSEAVGNTVYKEAIEETAQKVEAGVGIGASLKKHKDFPVMVSQMVDVGEKTGNIDEILSRLADFYNNEVDAMTKTLSSLLEPILMIVMGVGVGILVASIIMPIYGLVQAF